jgi:hypothetical protein
MNSADYDIQEHLARQLLDPDLHFKVKEYVIVGNKRRRVEKLVSGFEALNHAIDLANGYKSKGYKRVRAALQKIKEEFEPLPMQDIETDLETDTDLLDFLRDTNFV